ncbi:DUF488 family protein [Glutamicibacter sp. JL.03c]|uniref:DUF488 domain-containing protein n=1 Tax=Glutamicibacter sp. JL.03c TaxID=2984842 RepID=UPI0021F7A1DA|nr:DUF488 family protein [Glutamicibacter sp. JL.03c]UYQ78622.1 DUF488 family protein [Glutamicibacter sp. JL.03c]
MTEILIKRAYAEPSEDDGYRILVDRLWPRGLTKAALELDQWAKSLAPSSELRKAWNHDPDRFEQFAEQYKDELNQNAGVDEFLELAEQFPTITLVFAARNEQANHAMVLREYLLEQMKLR